MAWAAIRANHEQLIRLRQDPGPVPGGELPAKFLRHADEQTVVGLAAVLKAIADADLSQQDFEAWSVLAAAQYLGRRQVSGALSSYRQQGPRSVSPHIIPQASLHSLSGAISVALSIRGPNLGIGGGPGAMSEGLLAALTSACFRATPGTWLVLTQWDPEPVAESAPHPPANPICHAVAVALSGPISGEGQGKGQLRLVHRTALSQQRVNQLESLGLPAAESLSRSLPFRTQNVPDLASYLETELEVDTMVPALCMVCGDWQIEILKAATKEHEANRRAA